MRKSAFAIFDLIAVAGCSRPKTGTTPQETIGNLVQALNTQDSDLLRANLDKTVLADFEKRNRFRWALDTTRGTTFSYAMIKADTDGTVANVSFWISSVGKIAMPKTQVDAQLYKEDGAWKFGTIWAINGKRGRS